jgi:Tol biopolymer transport system component
MFQKIAVLRRAQFVTCVATLGLLAFVLPSWVGAAIPGQNGLIAFQSIVEGSSQLMVVNSDGTDVRPLAPGQAGESSWSPDGTQIAFAAGNPGGTHIWIMDFFTGAATPLTLNSPGYDDNPAWSPDGSKIAFTSCSGLPITCGIWVVNVDGTSPVNLTQTLGSHSREPAWSPDGSKIAFTLDGDIYVMSSDGSAALRLTDSPDRDTSSDWSPDGALIAFARLDAQQVSTIWTMNADGSNPHSLALGDQPVYSPDGTRIAFVLATGSSSDLWTMNADGTGSLALVATSADELAPSWQPLNGHGKGKGKGKDNGHGHGNSNGNENH